MKNDTTIDLATIEPMKVLTFRDRDELLRTLRSIPKDLVCLVGYIDENGDIQALKKSDLGEN